MKKIIAQKQAYKYWKLTASALIFLLSTFGLSGCVASPETDPATLTINGTPVEVGYVLKVNGKKVSLEEYRYYFMNSKHLRDEGDPTYWEQDTDGSMEKELKAEALKALKETYAVQIMAENLNLSLTEIELQQIESDVKNQISTLGGKQEYMDALSENYLTDGLYRFLWKTNFSCEKLWTYFFAEGGEFYNSDSTITDEERETLYSNKFSALIAEASDALEIKFSSEYDLIGLETLH